MLFLIRIVESGNIYLTRGQMSLGLSTEQLCSVSLICFAPQNAGIYVPYSWMEGQCNTHQCRPHSSGQPTLRTRIESW